MNGTILFDNSKVAEPTVAVGKKAGERKEQFTLTAIVAMLSIFFIATFITVGFFVPRAFQESLSGAGYNRKSELYGEVSVEADEDFIEWYGKGSDTPNEVQLKPLDVYKADVGLVKVVPAKTETRFPNEVGYKPLPTYKEDFTVGTVSVKIQTLERKNVLVYETVLAKPCCNCLTNKKIEFLPNKVVDSGRTKATKTESISIIGLIV